MDSRNYVESSMISDLFDVRIREALGLMCCIVVPVFRHLEVCYGLLTRGFNALMRNESVVH
jgi:hypothetical protein